VQACDADRRGLSLHRQGRTFGAPGLTAGTGYASRREQPRESRAAEITGRMRPESPGSRRCGAAASLAPFRAAALRARRLPRTASPAPAAASPRRNAPDAAPNEQARPSRSREVRPSPYEGHSHRAGTPRIVRGGPSTRKGTRRSFLTAPQKASSGPTLARGASAAPAGLTARARPEARPDGRAANLRSRPGIYQENGEDCSGDSAGSSLSASCLRCRAARPLDGGSVIVAALRHAD
jgi:hypothetical protein